MVRLGCPAGAPCVYATEDLEEGNALAMLTMHVALIHPQQQQAAAPPAAANNKKPEKFPRPNIDLDATAETWQDFYTAWLQYKDEYGLAGQAITRQLYACCSTELSTSLSGGAHFTLQEDQLLENMKKLSVRYQNPAVHVQEFLGTTQQPDEGVRHFLSRLKGVASRCQFDIHRCAA